MLPRGLQVAQRLACCSETCKRITYSWYPDLILNHANHHKCSMQPAAKDPLGPLSDGWTIDRQSLQEIKMQLGMTEYTPGGLKRHVCQQRHLLHA